MRKILFPFLLLVLSIAISCESSDSDSAPVCKVLKYNIYTETATTILYRTELVWQGNLVTYRLNYGNALSGGTGLGSYGLISKDSITYNQNNLVEKIYYGQHGSALEKYDVFFYESNNPLPYRREQIRNLSNGYVERKIENITYENGRISNTNSYFDDEPDYHTITDYTYNADGNLIQKVETSHPNSNSFERVETITYSNYDDHINPFTSINVPFAEDRHLHYSKNNFQKIVGVIREDGVVALNYEWEISGLQYNALGYPLICDYLCD